MNETLSIVNEVLVKAIATVESATEFATGQVPLVVNELLLFTFWKSLIVCCLGLIPVLLIPLVYSLCWKQWHREQRKSGLSYTSDFQDFLVVIVGMYTIVSIVITCVTLSANFEWFKIWLAPKVFLLEYASKLVN